MTAEYATATNPGSTAHGSAFRALTSSSQVVCAMVALAWANSPWADSYFAFVDRNISIQIGGVWTSGPVTFFVNQGLMAIFFLAVTLGIKRGVILGQSTAARVSAPRVSEAFENAIVLGIVALALIAARSLTGGTVSVDGGVAATAIASILVLCSGAGIASTVPYIGLGLGLGVIAVRASLHPGIAAILVGAMVPSWRRVDPQELTRRIQASLAQFEQVWPFSDPGPTEPQQQEAIDGIVTTTRQAQSPLIGMERAVGKLVVFGVVPLFVIANAGVALRESDAVIWAVVIGVAIAVVVIKPVLAFLSARLAAACGGMVVTNRSRQSPLGFRDADGVRFVAGLFLIVWLIGDRTFRDSAVLGLVTGSVMLALASTLAAAREARRMSGPHVFHFPVPGRAKEHSRA